jgi:Tfp pilus assembly protein PilE
MRIFIAISIVVASVSSASAQFALDHGQAAAAAQAARQEQAYQSAKASAIANGTPLLPSQQTNFSVGGRATIKVLARTAEELKADQAAGAAWSARCQPTVVEDKEGLRRVKYAEKDCDLSRFNTAGN